MSTPRKHWFRVGDSILREEFDREQRSTLIGLLAWFNQRRQRDGYRGARAQEASIPPGDLLTITLSDSLPDARACIERIRSRCELRVEARGAFTVVRWPNLAKFQEWQRPSAARALPADCPPIARRTPPPTPTPTPTPTPGKEKSKISCSKTRTHPTSKTQPGAMWELGLAAAALYLPTPPRWRLTGERKRSLATLATAAPDRGPDAFAHLVHGYIAKHRRVREGFDPMAFFTPESLLRAGKRQERLEAYDTLIASGQDPPFAMIQVLPAKMETAAERQQREMDDYFEEKLSGRPNRENGRDQGAVHGVPDWIDDGEDRPLLEADFEGENT